LIAASYLNRLTREHALLMTCACAAVLMLSFPSTIGNWTSLNLSSVNSGPNESEIDSALQQAATASLGQREGAIIVMDAQTGRIRALVNSQLAFGQALMPGSTMKPFTALAALRAGLIDKDSRTVCPGRFTGRGFSLPCVHEDHLPPFTPAQAIAYSCNYYFATLGERLGRDKLVETARQFGFGQPTGISEETSGTLRPCESGNNATIRESAHASAQTDCDAREAIGESDHIQITPIQLLMAYTALVNGGRLWQPRISRSEPIERSRIDISQQHRAIIIEGMRGAVRYGTARNAHLDSLPLYVLGKTGTSQPAKGFRSNGWFVGFASRPRADSSAEPTSDEIELAVLVLMSRSHGAEAATLAKPIFETFAEQTEDFHRRDVEKRTVSAETEFSNSAIRNPQSAIFKVHLVTENVTQELSLEDYVVGVMRAEGSMETEPEALKALAIAIRTYALKNHGRHAKDGYDFCSTTHCQRFIGGKPTVREGAASNQGTLPDGRVSAAVRATEDQILIDERGQLVDSYFGASCGGETANIGTLWGQNPPAYLRGVHDEFCVTGPHANWTDVISRADLLRALQSDARTNVGVRLDQITISRRDETGRAEFITLEGEHRKIVRGWDFKIIVGRVLGWNLLKSSRFEFSRNGSNFVFRGSGFGHGLGLCQEGAHVMAQRGASYQRILEKYFPGTRVGPHSGSVSLARPFKAGRQEDTNLLVASATNEMAPVPSSLRRRSEWREDIMPALKRLGRITRRYATSTQPRSGPMFIVPKIEIRNKLRSSEILSIARAGKQSHFAPTELAYLLSTGFYKYFVPTGLTTTNQRYLTISSDHFRVAYSISVDRRDADQVLNTLESARTDYLHRANAASVSIADIPTLEIHLNESTGDFTARTGQPWWAAAATKGNHIEMQPVALLKHRGVLVTTLRHELAHVVIDAVSNNRAPRWLEEGFAIYLAGEGPTISRYATKTKLDLVELERRLERPSSQQEMRALYAVAYQRVMELLRGGGEARVWKQLSRG
jgi:SpoIID/LytB domain protein